jgi:hypothetical protein
MTQVWLGLIFIGVAMTALGWFIRRGELNR